MPKGKRINSWGFPSDLEKKFTNTVASIHIYTRFFSKAGLSLPFSKRRNHKLGSSRNTMAPTKSIAIITGSTRTPRVGPHIAEFVKQVIQEKASLEGVEISAVDLAEFKLPIYDEPAVPAMIPEPDKYTHEHSRRWAQEIARHDGYVLVSPEYNYGMPGGVKNAIDYLFHPWKGKPIGIVTYGLNGGKTSSEQLEHTLSRMGLQVCDASTPVLPLIRSFSLLSTAPAFINQ
jgi:NAD(P)H-dependent FMN reductase